MSYARLSDDSDVYVYLAGDHYACCFCFLNPRSQRFSDTRAMLAHLREHEAAGHKVPASCVEEIMAQGGVNDAYLRGEISEGEWDRIATAIERRPEVATFTAEHLGD